MSCTAVVCAKAVRAEALVHAAWAALTAGRPRELQGLEDLLARQERYGLAAKADGPEWQALVRRLQLLLAATERNLRVLRGQDRM